jgi:phosphoglycolate phosphatase-like HAD superfamily hydrolase
MKARIFEKLFKTASYSALSKQERDKFEESLKYYNDLKNSLDTAFEEGKEEARMELMPIIEKKEKDILRERKQKEEAQIKEAEAQKQKEEARRKEAEALRTIKTMVKNLHSKGIPVPEIAVMTGKTEAEIKELLAG